MLHVKLCLRSTAFGLLLLVHLSLQSTDDGIPPVLTVNIADVELQEKEDARTQLGAGPVVTCVDADGDQVRAFISSISPTSGCGMSCIQLEPCGGDDFCLWYLAKSRTVSFSATGLYTLTIGCTDDVETVVTQDVTVTIVSNSPPTFVPNAPPSGSTSTHGLKTTHESRTDLYKVETTDADGDPVFYTMSTDPITDLLEIEYATGQIKAAHDLRMLCEPSVEASVWARDSHSSAVGPFSVDITIDNYNVRPSITNLDTTVTIDENVHIDKRVLEFDVIDPKLNDLNYNQRSLTSAGMEAYGMRAPSLRTLIELDYEREDTRSVKLYFDVDDGYCRSETYSLTVNVNDLPEEPEYSNTYMLIMTDEGHINEPNNVFILDEDLNEVHTHAKESGSSDLFDVEPTTGNIVSINEVLLVPGRQYKDYTVRMRATDKDGLQTSRYEAKVRVFDINDNKPYFTNFHQPFRVSAHECMDPGSILGRVKGTDDDSTYNQNNWVYFGGGGGNFAIAANGWVVLTHQCINGETYIGSATIADQGINPGPLTGDPMEVQVVCGPCPTGDATTAATATTTAPGASNGTTTSGTVSQGDGGSSTDDLLVWAIPALLAAVTWLALTICLLYRFCRNPCAGCCQNRTPTPIRVTPEPPKEAKPTPPKAKPPPPPPKPKTPLPPPPPPPPVVKPDPYMFGFWKETYTDQDQKSVPKTGKPTAIESMPVGGGNALPPEHLRLGPPGADATLPRFLPGNAPAVSTAEVGPLTLTQPPKKKTCIIL